MSTPETPSELGGADAAALATAVLTHEEDRKRTERSQQSVVLPDDLLPGVGGESMSVREAVDLGGRSMLVVLFLLNVIDGFDGAAMAVLAPDIKESLDISNTVLAAVGAATGLLFLLAAMPISSLADRSRRTTIGAVSMGAWSVFVACTAFVQNAAGLFVVRMGAGLSQAHNIPIDGSLLSDTYPIAARGRVFAAHALANPVGAALGPLTVGAIAALVGGDEGWRAAFLLIPIPAAILAVALAFVPEPPRGRYERQAVLGEQAVEGNAPEPSRDLPVSTAAAFDRLRRIRTFRFLLLGMGALGFALFSIPLFTALFLEDRFGLDAAERGVLASIAALPAFFTIPAAGVLNDRLFRRSPPRSLLLCGGLIAASGLLYVTSLYLPTLVTMAILFISAGAVSSAAGAMIPAIVAAIVPYRLRARGFTLGGIYMLVFGAFLGAVLTGVISDALSVRAALTIVVLPSSVIGGALIAYGAHDIRADISLAVEEILEEQEEKARMSAPGAELPVIQLHDIDFGYGPVQVLFGVDLEVSRGETLALLGTNGAGKSTVLRVISGLGYPSRGVVRLAGRTITYVEAETRVRLGIVQLPGGQALFDGLSVGENLRTGAHLLRHDRAEARRRIERAVELFPDLKDRFADRAGDLSGGQQQMLALAKALLVDPEVLLIDELSLGLAPVALQEILAVSRS